MGKCPVEKVKLDRMNLDEQPLATRQLLKQSTESTAVGEALLRPNQRGIEHHPAPLKTLKASIWERCCEV